MPFIEVPCEIGEKVYHVHRIKYRKAIESQVPITARFTINETFVTAIHFGQRLRGIGDTYVRLSDATTGYMTNRLSFTQFNESCFRTYDEAKSYLNTLIKIEEDLEKQKYNNK